MTTTSRAAWLQRARQQLSQAAVPNPQTDAFLLLAHVTGLGRSQIITSPDALLTEPQLMELESLLGRRLLREPLQHLLGEITWGDIRLRCDKRALIPRPETEWLLELLLKDTANLKNPQLADIGTGTGALALAYKAAHPDGEVWAFDISEQALELARENAALNQLSVSFCHSDLLEGAAGLQFDVIVSNPPYLPASDAEILPPEVRHDPALALFGGADGLELARRLLKQASHHLRVGGLMWLELDPRNAADLAALAASMGFEASLHTDLAGRERFVRLVRLELLGLASGASPSPS